MHARCFTVGNSMNIICCKQNKTAVNDGDVIWVNIKRNVV